MKSTAPKTSVKWWLLILAFIATVINYLDRQTLSVMAPLLLQKFHISQIDYGRIIFVFMLAYTLMNGISGRLLDHLGTKMGYALFISFWSGAELLHIFTQGAFSLGIFRFALGMGEAGNYPAGVRLITEWFPPDERSHASGIFNSGAAVGAILAPPLLAWIAITMNWQVAFGVVGLLGFIWLLVWLAVYPRDNHSGSAHRPTVLPFNSLLRSRFIWQFTLSKFFSDPVWYFYTFWYPQYLKIAHSLSLRQIGATAWIPFATAALGNLAGGVLFGWLARAGINIARARRIAILIFSAFMVPAVFVGFTTSIIGCITIISVATFGYSAALANLLALPGDVYPKDAVASVWGLASVGSGLGGMLFSLLTGWLVDRYSFQPAFILFGILPLLSAVTVWFLPWKIEANLNDRKILISTR